MSWSPGRPSPKQTFASGSLTARVASSRSAPPKQRKVALPYGLAVYGSPRTTGLVGSGDGDRMTGTILSRTPRFPMLTAREATWRAQRGDAFEQDAQGSHRFQRWRTELEEELIEVGSIQPQKTARPPAKLSPVVPCPPLLPADERVQISEAIWGPHDAVTMNCLRGDMPQVLELRSECKMESARERRQRHLEMGREQRRRAAEWRSYQQRINQPAPVPERPATDDSSPKTSRLRPQEMQLSVRIAGISENQDAPDASDVRNSCLVEATVQRLSALPQAPPFISQEGQHHEQNFTDVSMVVKTSTVIRRMRERIAAGILSRETQAKKLAKVKKRRNRKVAELPETERLEIQTAFDMYADPTTEKLPAQNLLRCLCELGLSGSSRHERSAVEHMCLQLCTTIAEEGASGNGAKDPAPASQGGHRRSVMTTFLPTRTLNEEDRTGETIAEAFKRRHTAGRFSVHPATSGRNHMSLTLEDVTVEIMPSVRTLLDEIRQATHFQEFHRLLVTHYADRKSRFETPLLNLRQWQEIVDDLYLDADVALDLIIEADLMPISVSSKTDVEAALEEPFMESRDFHILLFELEERTERIRRKQEHAIKEKTEMPTNIFWRYRHDLLRLHRLFLAHTDSTEGKISVTELLQLLKHCGFEPYRVETKAWLMVNALLVEFGIRGHHRATNRKMRYGDFFHATNDQRHTGSVTLGDLRDQEAMSFTSFLLLMERVRHVQKELRRDVTEAAFQRGDKDASLTLDMSEVMPLLNEIGLDVKPRDKDRLQRMIDEFDVDASGDLSFSEFEEIVQRVVENVQSIGAEHKIAHAVSVGLSRKELADYNWAFDQVDKDNSGGVSFPELQKVLRDIGHELHSEQLRNCYHEINLNPEKELSLFDFMRVLKVALYEDKLVLDGLPYTLKDVSDDKMTQILQCWKLASKYIATLSRPELEEITAQYLDVKVWTNLREELTEPIADSKQLLNYAERKAERERLASDRSKKAAGLTVSVPCSL